MQIVDSFAGGGGASTGIEMALGRSPDIAINHDATALNMHKANHPRTLHLTENVWQVDLSEHTKGQPIGLLWASPDCRHFSKARGGAPTNKSVRGLAWSIAKFIKQLGHNKPRVIIMENVEEFKTWEDFATWQKTLRKFGYKIEMRELRACDFGAPTIRKRLFIVMRSDGMPIIWPEPSHGAPESAAVIAGKLHPWRTAAECINFSLPCPSIFDTAEQIKEKYGLRAKRPLAEATLRRVAQGVEKYVINNASPFIVNLTHGARNEPVDEPLRTVTGAHRGEKALITPFVSYAQHGGANRSALDPMHTIAASRKDQNLLVSAFLAQHNGNGVIGRKADAPISTITTRGTQTQLVSAHLMHLKGSNRNASSVEQPLHTICANGTHAALVSAFMVKYYGQGIGQSIDEPCHTVTTKDRYGLVNVEIDGIDYTIIDIGMRMLTPRELFRAQGFPDNYIIDRGADGSVLSKTDQIHKCGNSVSPEPAKALVHANCAFLAMKSEAA